MECPKCVGMLEEKSLSFHQVEGLKELRGAGVSGELVLDVCFVCGGAWFDHGELRKYLTEGLKAVDSPSLGKQVDEDMNKKEGHCPRCKVLLAKDKDPFDAGIQIDTCKKCHGIWLDSTEIDLLEKKTGKAKVSGLFAMLKGFLQRR